jgi:hypothetical protein
VTRSFSLQLWTAFLPGVDSKTADVDSNVDCPISKNIRSHMKKCDLFASAQQLAFRAFKENHSKPNSQVGSVKSASGGTKVNQLEEKYFPTIEQRRTLEATDAELLGVIRHQADRTGFVASDVPLWARQLHAWPEAGSTPEGRERFVAERIESFLKFGILQRSGGRSSRGFIVQPSTTASTGRRGKRVKPRLTSADAKFLRALAVAW